MATQENFCKEICKKHSSEIYLRPLLKSARLFSPRTRRINDFRSFHCGGLARNETLYAAQRNRPKSDSISLKRPPLERKFPADCAQRRRNSTCQLRKPSNIKRHFVPTNQMIQEMVKNRKLLKTHEKRETVTSLKKEPRTYAQLISNYSQMMYGDPVTKTLKDSTNTAAINGIHSSPFSTDSAVSTKWKCKARTVKSGYLRVTSSNTRNQQAKYSSGTCYECRNDSNNFIATNNEDNNTYERLSYSYAMMIEKYSNTMDVDPNDGNSLVPKCNAISKLNDFSTILIDSMNRTMENGLREGTLPSYNEKRTRINWMSKVEDVIKDLKRITLKKDAIDSKTRETSSLQSVSECAEWIDRVVTAHKKRKSGVNSELRTALNSPVMNENRSAEATMIASSSKSSSIANYIKRSPVSGTTSQTPTNVAAGSKQPQIELRMTPSQNESVVSINVDEQAAKSAGTGNKEQLSVVISSNRNNPKVESTKTNFDSMQISISENTVPVKQIEFSINGKPVSELKSIVARADKLDVVTSMDKVEIRIPQKENAAKQTSTVKATSNPTQVLNLQIAAKFNEPRAQQPKDTGIKTSTAIPSTTPASVPTPGQPPIPTPTKAPPYNPRTQSLASSRTMNTRSADVSNKSNMNMPSRNNPQSTINENSDIRTPDERTPSDIIPWWSSEDPFKKIRKKRYPPKNVSAFIKPKKVEEPAVRQRFEETNAAKDLTSKKPEENSPDVPQAINRYQTKKTTGMKRNESSNFSKQSFRVVPARNPRKVTQIKCKNNKPNKVKKRYRIKKPRASNKKRKPIISAVRPSKYIKYVPVNPQRFLVLESPKMKAIAGEVKMKTKDEGTKDDAKSKNVAENAKETGAQRPNTELKPTKNSEKPDNKPADVSAKIAGKEEGKSVVGGKNLPVEEDQRVKQILKSMKPIEKRKDGTLIDYGVVVPSRTPSNIRHVPSTRVNRIDQKATTRPEEIEPRKVFLKNEALKETKSVQKVESEKITFVKKEVEPSLEEKSKSKPEKKDLKDEKPVKTMQTQVISEDSATGFSEKNQSLKRTDTKEISDKSNLSKIGNSKTSEDNLKLKSSEKAGSSSLKPEKDKLKTVQPSKIPVKSSNTNMPDGVKSTSNKLTQGNVVEDRGSKTATGSEGKVKLHEKLFAKPPKVPVKASDIHVANPSKTKIPDKVNIPPRKEASKSSLKSETVDKKKEDAKLSTQPSKVSIKYSDANVTSSKPQMPDKLKDTTLKKEASSTSKLEAEEKKKMDAKLSTQTSKVSIKPSGTSVTGSEPKIADKLKNITPEKEALKSTPKSEAEEKKKMDAKLSTQTSKVSIKPSGTSVTGSEPKIADKLKNITPEKEVASTPKSEAEEKKKMDAKLSTEPSKDSTKPGDTSNFSSLTKEPASQQSTEKTEGNILTPDAQVKVDSSFEDKKVTRTDSLPLTGAIVAPSEKSIDKQAKNDSKSSEESNVQSEKKLNTVETAPLEGTINYQAEKKLDNPTSSSSAKEKALPEEIEKDLCTKSNPSSSGKGGGGSGPGVPTGPAGLLSTRSFIMSKEYTNMLTYSKNAVSDMKVNRLDRRAKSGEISYRSNKERSDEMRLFSEKTERPEKSILYSSWLQRFKGRLDDDNVT